MKKEELLQHIRNVATADQMYNTMCNIQSSRYADIDISQMEKELLDEDGRVREASIEVWRGFSDGERWHFMSKHNIFVAPTTELLDYLDLLIGDHPCIEICAGKGYLGQMLDIDHITDSYIQTTPEYRRIITERGGIPMEPPSFVERLEATAAAKKYRPHTILCSYGTHKDTRIGSSGSDEGVDFKTLKRYCRRIIFIGNTETHKDNPMTREAMFQVSGLISKAGEEGMRVWIWEKRY